MHRGVACCVVALLLVASVPAGGATPDDAIGLPQEFDPDNVSLTASLDEDGNATWTFTYRMRMETENETEAFESLRADVQNNSSAYTGQFRERIVDTVDSADNATNRSMSVSNVSISTRVNALNEEDIGVVTYTFEWSNFAAVDGERVEAGDALEGFYLDNETSLRVTWPERFALADVDPEADRPNENAVEWSGPTEFSAGQPRVVVSPSENNGDGGDGGNQGTASPTTPGSGLSGLLVPAVAGAMAAVLVVGAAGWYYREQRGSGPPVDGGGDATPGGDTEVGVAADAAADAEEEDPPEELLSNEERVKKFLREQGGRAKQQAVVDEMDWTEAKTSQVVKQMREDGDVESFRIGRENVLKLPGEDEEEEEL